MTSRNRPGAQGLPCPPGRRLSNLAFQDDPGHWVNLEAQSREIKARLALMRIPCPRRARELDRGVLEEPPRSSRLALLSWSVLPRALLLSGPSDSQAVARSLSGAGEPGADDVFLHSRSPPAGPRRRSWLLILGIKRSGFRWEDEASDRIDWNKWEASFVETGR